MPSTFDFDANQSKGYDVRNRVKVFHRKLIRFHRKNGVGFDYYTTENLSNRAGKEPFRFSKNWDFKSFENERKLVTCNITCLALKHTLTGDI